MRILFVTRRYWPSISGGESYLRPLASALAESHEVTVLAHSIGDSAHGPLTDSLRQPPVFESFDDGAVHVCPLHVPRLRQVALAPMVALVTPGLRRYAYGRIRVALTRLYASVVGPVIAERARHADILHMWGSDFIAAAAVHTAGRLGIPSVVTPFAHRGQWGDDPASRAAYRGADRVVALLEDEALLYRELDIPVERVVVVGVCSEGVASGRAEEIRKRHAIEGPIVMFLAVRRPYKGLDILMQAAPLIARRSPNVTFLVAGPGPTLPRGAGGGARVLDLGVIDDDGRAAWLEAADLLCLPSSGEIFPVSFLEAWSVHTPIVTADIPALSELMRASGGGVVTPREPVALAKAISGLLVDSERRASLGAAGYEFWHANHRPPAIADRHAQLYASLL